MEALSTKLDNLQWEVNRLDAENTGLRAQDWEASERVDLELEVKQLKQDASETAMELQSMKEVLLTKEAGFADETAKKAQQLKEMSIKLQQAETELSSVRQERLQQSEMYEEQIIYQSTQIEQLQQVVENNKLLHYRALDAEKQKWEARAARLTVQLDKSTECFRVLQDMGKSSRHSVSEKSALLKDYDSICSPAISEISTNTSYKPSCSKRETCVEAETDNENVYITTSTPFTNSWPQ